MPVYSIMRDHRVETTVEELWAFLTNPNNLEQLTPKKFGGKRIGDVSKSMISEGMTASYKIRLFPFVSIKWVAQYKNIKALDCFTDIQLQGLFRKWEHQHIIIVHQGNVIMRDVITFEPPMPIIGEYLYENFILPKFHTLFNYRDKQLDLLFPKPPRPPFGPISYTS